MSDIINTSTETYIKALSDAENGGVSSKRFLDDIKQHIESGGTYTITDSNGIKKKFFVNDDGEVEVGEII